MPVPVSTVRSGPTGIAAVMSAAAPDAMNASRVDVGSKPNATLPSIGTSCRPLPSRASTTSCCAPGGPDSAGSTKTRGVERGSVEPDLADEGLGAVRAGVEQDARGIDEVPVERRRLAHDLGRRAAVGGGDPQGNAGRLGREERHAL